MSPNKARKDVRKIDVPTNIPTEFELGDTSGNIQRREERTEGKRGGRETTEGREGEGGSQEGGNSTVTDSGG